MAKVDDRTFAQLLKSFNLIYICPGRFLYAAGPSGLRFSVWLVDIYNVGGKSGANFCAAGHLK